MTNQSSAQVPNIKEKKVNQKRKFEFIRSAYGSLSKERKIRMAGMIMALSMASLIAAHGQIYHLVGGGEATVNSVLTHIAVGLTQFIVFVRGIILWIEGE